MPCGLKIVQGHSRGSRHSKCNRLTKAHVQPDTYKPTIRLKQQELRFWFLGSFSAPRTCRKLALKRHAHAGKFVPKSFPYNRNYLATTTHFVPRITGGLPPDNSKELTVDLTGSAHVTYTKLTDDAGGDIYDSRVLMSLNGWRRRYGGWTQSF